MAWIRDPQTGAVVDDGENAWVDAPAAPTAEKSGVLRRAVGDPLTGLAKGVLVGIPQAAVGLGRLATLGMADPLLNPVSTTLNDMSKRIDKAYSPEHTQQAKEVAETKGFLPTIGALLSRPGYVADTVIEQLPTMFGGAKLGQLATGAKGLKAGAVGEGLVTAGQNVEAIHQGAGGESSVGQKLLGGVSGAVTGIISGVSGKLAQKVGITDIDVAMAGGGRGSGKLLPSMGKAFVQEGVLEEMPQSAQEQMFQNAALDRPLTEGMAESAATGMVLGGVMGAGAQALNRPNPQDEMHNKRMREALAGIQLLSSPSTDGQVTKEQTGALRAIRDYAVNVAGGDPAELVKWELAQQEALGKVGGAVSFDGVPGVTSDEAAKSWAAGRIAEIQGRAVAPQAAVDSVRSFTDDFGTEQIVADAPYQPEVAGRSLTKQEKAEVAKLEAALASGDAQEAARLQNKLAYLTTPPATAAAAPPAAAKPASEPPAAPKADSKKPATWDDATLAERASKLEPDDLTPAANAIRKEVGKRAEASRTYADADPMPSKAVRGHGIATLTSPSTSKAYSNGTVSALEKQIAAKLPSGGTVGDLINTLGGIANDQAASSGLVAELAQQYGQYLVKKTQGGSNVQTTNVDQGAQPVAGNTQGDAANPIAPAQEPAQGNAAGQSSQETAKEAGAGSTVIPYDTVSFNSTTNSVDRSSGSSEIIDYAGRKIVMRNVNGVMVPFYLSTGNGGKADVAAGKWYPFFGISKDGWLNKTGGKQMMDHYGNAELAAVAEELNRTIGDIRGDNAAHPKTSAAGAHVDFINQHMNPAENETPTSKADLTANITGVLQRIEAGRVSSTETKESQNGLQEKTAQEAAKEEVAPPAEPAAAKAKKSAKPQYVSPEVKKQAANAKRQRDRATAKAQKDEEARAETLVANVNTVAVAPADAGGATEREAYLSSLFNEAQSLLDNQTLPAAARDAVSTAQATVKRLAEEQKKASAAVSAEVKAAAAELRKAEEALESFDKASVRARAGQNRKYLEDMVSLAKATLEQANKKASEGSTAIPKVEAKTRRTRQNDGETFAFEVTEYDPKAPHASGSNFLWVQSAMDAIALAYPQVLPKDKAGIAEMENAKEALEWLMKDNYGAETLKLIADRNAQIEKTFAKQKDMRAKIQSGLKQLYDQLRHEYLEAKTGQTLSEAEAKSAKLTKQEEDKLARQYVEQVERMSDAHEDGIYGFISDVAGTSVGAYKVLLEQITAGKASLSALLTNIASMSSTPALRELAKALNAKGVEGVKVVYKPELSKGLKADGTPGWRRGTYNAETNTITIYQGGENAQVILHEVVHAMTVRALNRAGAITSPKNQEEVQARKGYLQLVELFEALKVMPEFAGEYAFKNVHEFVAEVNSNPKLQEKLSNTLPPAGLFGKLGKSFGSAMDAFIEAIRNLLGLRPTSVDALTIALQVTAGYFEPNQGAVKSTGSFDSLSSPIAAVTAPFQKAQQYLISADKAMGKLNLTDLKAEAYKVWLGAVSSDYISAAAKRIPGLGKLQEFIGNWFETDRRKTQVKSLISKDVYDGFVRKFELALRDTGDYNRYNKLMGDMAGEASRLGFDITKNFEDNNVGRGGKTQQPKLEPHLREHVNKLHQQFKSLQQSPNKSLKALANLLVEGEKVNRKMFTMQIATNIRDILHHHAQSGKSPAAATVLLNKYAGALDILQDSKGLTNTNPGMQLDGLSAKLHDTLMEVFDNAETYFPKGDIQDDLKTIRKAYMQAWSAPYMHLGRHGMYVVKFNVKEANAQAVAALGKLLGDRGFTFGPFLKTAEGQSREVFLRVETLKEMQEIEALLRGTSGLVGQKDGKLDLQAGAISDVGVDNMFGVGKTMEALRTRMNARFEGVRASAAKNPAMKQAYEDVMAMMTQEFLDMLDVNSARQVNQQRKGITGYSSDYMQNFAKRAQWADASIANMYTMRDYSLAFKGMQDSIDGLKSTDSKAAVRGQAIHDELATRFSNSLKPNTNRAVNVLSVFGHNFYLALSPAYTIGNLLQPYMLTLPLLGGRHGFVKTAKAMGKATADIMGLVKHSVKEGWQEGGWRGILDAKLELSKSGITADELAFVQHLIRSGIVDATQSHELGRMAKGESSSVATAAKTLSMFNHYSEVTNRLTAGLTAYRLAKANPIKGVDPTEYAIDAVRRTQYDYADHNKARYIGRHGVFGAATPLFMQFQTFAFFTMEHYLRMFKDGFIEKMPPGHEREKVEARKALAGTLTATALVAGTMGLPFATVLAAAANAAGDDDRDARARYREWLVSIFGKDMAEIVAKGALSRGVAGIDLTGSLGQQDLLPGSRWMADRRNWEDKIKDQSKTMLGPAINAGFDIYGGIDKAKNGDVMAGIHQLMPRFLKGPIGALDVAEKGAFSNKSGTTLPIPVTSWDYLKMMGGWTPQKKAEQSEANFYFQSEQTQRKQDKARAKKEITTARDAGDYELAASLLLQHNLDHPTDRIAGLGGTMAAKARGQAYAALSGSGILDANRKHLPTMQAYGAWANTGIDHE